MVLKCYGFCRVKWVQMPCATARRYFVCFVISTSRGGKMGGQRVEPVELFMQVLLLFCIIHWLKRFINCMPGIDQWLNHYSWWWRWWWCCWWWWWWLWWRCWWWWWLWWRWWCLWCYDDAHRHAMVCVKTYIYIHISPYDWGDEHPWSMVIPAIFRCEQCTRVLTYCIYIYMYHTHSIFFCMGLVSWIHIHYIYIYV